MSRKRRHITARPDEWIVVHRPKQADSSGCLAIFLILGIVFVLLKACS